MVEQRQPVIAHDADTNNADADDGPAGDVRAALAAAVAALPGGGEARDGQVEMAEAVAHAAAERRHLIVRAGTGTGKSLAYLVPLIASRQRVVVATATKALQDQLAAKDLPFLGEHLDIPFEAAVVKGRSNYVCRQRLHESTAAGDGQLSMGELLPSARDEIRRLAVWAETSRTGDQAELDWTPSVGAWQAVSVTAEECPGALRCPFGPTCFAEEARWRAASADVVVVNTHLYGMHVASDGALLPEHDVVVFDEAHQLEDVVSDTAGLSVTVGRFTALARTVNRVVADDALVARLGAAGDEIAGALAPWHGRRLPQPLPAAIVDAIVATRARVDDAAAALRAITTEAVDVNQRKIRAQKGAGSLAVDLDAVVALPDSSVAWVGGSADDPRLEVAPVDVGPVLAMRVWDRCTAVLTSATIPANLAERVGLAAGSYDALDVGSPFDYAANALLYCAAHLPDPRRPEFEAASHEELRALIEAAGGRTLALFTSWRAMKAAVDALRPHLPYPVLGQADLPKPALLRAFADDDAACLFATTGLFQGVDVPGATLSLVTVDRLPFPRPDDPLLEARRERAGANAFRAVDLPRAATMLAQAAGRLIRTATDRGVVAVLDPRLAKASYRWDVVRALPPMQRTRHRAEAEAFLRSLR
jgi:ATP-dependent DNA helicase DinG